MLFLRILEFEHMYVYVKDRKTLLLRSERMGSGQPFTV